MAKLSLDRSWPPDRWTHLPVVTAAFEYCVHGGALLKTTNMLRPEHREASFAAGRAAAAEALRHLGRTGVHVDVGADGEPVFPQGTTGSLAHTDDWAVAVAMPSSGHLSMGIDAEDLFSPEVAEEISTQIMSSDERETLRHSGLPFSETATVLFCAKEAFYKAQFPVTRRRLEFLDVEVTSLSDRQVSLRPRESFLPSPEQIEIAVLPYKGRWVAFCTLHHNRAGS